MRQKKYKNTQKVEKRKKNEKKTRKCEKSVDIKGLVWYIIKCPLEIPERQKKIYQKKLKKVKKMLTMIK